MSIDVDTFIAFYCRCVYIGGMGIPKGSKRTWEAGRKKLTKKPEDVEILILKIPRALLEQTRKRAGGNLSQYVREAIRKANEEKG